MKFLETITIIIVLQIIANGQQLSLKQCIDYSLKNNSNIKISSIDQAITQKKLQEQVGSALPQVSLSSSMDDNLSIATQMMPGALMGQPGSFIPVKMGTPYSFSAGVQVDQKIYDPSLIASLKAAKICKDQSSVNLLLTKEQTVYAVCRAYYQTQIIEKQSQLLKTICNATNETLEATKLRYSNGLVKKIDVDKISISYSNITTQKKQAELSYKQSLNNLKYQIGMPLDTQLVLSEDSSLALELTIPEKTDSLYSFFNKRTDYQLLKINVSLQQAGRSNSIASILPSLSFNARYNYQSMPDDLTFNGDWYNSSSIGLRLSIPVFDGFRNRSRVIQSDYAIEKAKENVAAAEQSIKIEVSNYEMQYRNALDNIENEKSNMQLAEDVYKNTQVSFQQGLASSLELVQAESSWRESQNNYFSKLLNLYFTRLDLEQSKGTLINFIETIK